MRFLVQRIVSVAVLGLALGGCGSGTGEGLDENGRPLGSNDTEPLVPTLAAIQANVFTPGCAVVGCHGGTTAAQGLRLDDGLSAASLINVPSVASASLVRVVPGDPDGSFLIHKLEGTQAAGDRMPQGGPYLPQATIDVIRAWIASGAPV